ncbi:MAG: cytochrome c biogenesis protein ResB [Chloroflexota bacterium]
MAHEVRTPPLGQAVAAGQAAAKPDVMDTVDEALEGLWHLLTSMRAGMILMLILAVLSVAGTLVAQIPTGMAGDAAAKADWLASIKPKYGGWLNVLIYGPGVITLITGIGFGVWAGLRATSGGSWILQAIGAVLVSILGIVILATDSLGLLNTFGSLLFWVLTGILMVSLIACTLHRTPGAYRTATKPRVDVGEGFFAHAPQRESIVVHATSAEALERVSTVLKQRRYRTLVQDDGTVHVYADKNRWVSFASLAGHISLIFILLGAVAGGALGYKNAYFAIAEGATIPTGTEDGLQMQLVDFTDSYYSTTGAPSDYTSQVILLKNGQQVAAQTIRVNDPLTYDGATYYQRSFGPAAAVTVTDASGKVLFTGGFPLDRAAPDGSDRSAGIVFLPSGEMLVVTGTNGTSDTVIQPGQVQAALYDSTGTTASTAELLDQGKAKAVGSYTVTFDREVKYTVLSISRDPGQYLVWFGALLLFVGFTAVFMLPQRRVWARISSRGATSVISVASLGRRETALGSDFDTLMSDIRTALQTPAQA